MNALDDAASALLKHKGLKGITGLRGALFNMPGSDAADAEANLRTLKSKIMIGALRDIRDSSKTGAGLGSVSDKEGDKLEASIASLEKAQSYEQIKASLDDIVEYAKESKKQTLAAYNRRYRLDGGQDAVAPPKGGQTNNGWTLKRH